MASELQFGIKHIRDGIPQQVVTGIDMAVIGIVGTADSADPQIFPLDTPVDMYSNDTAKLTAHTHMTEGVLDGTLERSGQFGNREFVDIALGHVHASLGKADSLLPQRREGLAARLGLR